MPGPILPRGSPPLPKLYPAKFILSNPDQLSANRSGASGFSHIAYGYVYQISSAKYGNYAVLFPRDYFIFWNNSVFALIHAGGVVQDGSLQQVSYAIKRSGCCQSESTNQVQV